MALPREAWPVAWAKAGYACPVIRLRRALPGLQQSGPLWNEYCSRVLVGRGWTKVLDVAADIWVKHVSTRLVILLVYVDDLLIVGADEQVTKEVEGLCLDPDPEHVTMSIGRCGPASMFLGVARVVTRSGAWTTTVSHQYQYIEAILVDYHTLVGQAALRRRATPVSTDAVSAQSLTAPGVHGDVAPHYLGALMWVMRCTRPDLAFALSLCARFLTKWCAAADSLLDHLVGYVESTKRYALVAWVCEGDTLASVTFTDADHGGCPLSSRSTTGKCAFLVGARGSLAPIRWSAARQGCTAVSTVEAEVVAMNDATRSYAVPLSDLLAVLGHQASCHKVLTDAEAARAAVLKGTSKTLTHLRKMHRVSLAALHDVFTDHEDLLLEHVPGVDNVADLFTKSFSGPRLALLRSWMCILPEGDTTVPVNHPARVYGRRLGAAA